MEYNGLLAWVEIWHPESDTVIKTIKEPVESKTAALEQFTALHRMISGWNSEFDGIILDTDIGMIRLPAAFVASSILQIRVDHTYQEENE
jgi:hypothetical protein